MKSRSIAFALFLVICLLPAAAFADKASAELECPTVAKVGSTIKIKVKFRHDGNNFFHHISWAYVKVNGKEIGRWKWDTYKKEMKKEKGKDDYFERELTYKITGPVEVKAEATCNIHGSAGIPSITIKSK